MCNRVYTLSREKKEEYFVDRYVNRREREKGLEGGTRKGWGAERGKGREVGPNSQLW